MIKLKLNEVYDFPPCGEIMTMVLNDINIGTESTPD
jgi:hypothetical protein